MTFSQLLRIGRKPKMTKSKRPLLNGQPQRTLRIQTVCTVTPKKPNSAQRKIVKGFVQSTSMEKHSASKKNKMGDLKHKKISKGLIAYVSGEGHKLQQHNVVLIQGGGAQDLPGVNKYSVIRGVKDHSGVDGRKNSRSLYGVKKG